MPWKLCFFFSGTISTYRHFIYIFVVSCFQKRQEWIRSINLHNVCITNSNNLNKNISVANSNNRRNREHMYEGRGWMWGAWDTLSLPPAPPTILSPSGGCDGGGGGGGRHWHCNKLRAVKWSEVAVKWSEILIIYCFFRKIDTTTLPTQVITLNFTPKLSSKTTQKWLTECHSFVARQQWLTVRYTCRWGRAAGNELKCCDVSTGVRMLFFAYSYAGFFKLILFICPLYCMYNYTNLLSANVDIMAGDQ